MINKIIEVENKIKALEEGLKGITDVEAMLDKVKQLEAHKQVLAVLNEQKKDLDLEEEMKLRERLEEERVKSLELHSKLDVEMLLEYKDFYKKFITKFYTKRQKINDMEGAVHQNFIIESWDKLGKDFRGFNEGIDYELRNNGLDTLPSLWEMRK